MDKKVALALIVFCLALPGGARAAGLPGPKIGLVDINQVLNNTEEGKKIRKQLEDEMAGKRRTIEEKKKEFDKQEEELQKQQLVLSKEALAEKRADLENKRAELGRLIFASQGEMQQKDKNFSEEMFKKISQVVTKVAVDEKLDLVLAGEKAPAGVVLYARDPIDLTSQVIQLYNKTNPAKKDKGK